MAQGIVLSAERKWMVIGMREKLIELAHDYFDSVPWYADIADLNPEELIDHLIASGVTIPVRCKDCNKFCPEEIRKLYNTEKYCMKTGWVVKDDDFCSYGERRTDD